MTLLNEATNAFPEEPAMFNNLLNTILLLLAAPHRRAISIRPGAARVARKPVSANAPTLKIRIRAAA